MTKRTSEKPAPAVVKPLKCWRCGKLLAEAAGPGTEIRCMRCGGKSNVP